MPNIRNVDRAVAALSDVELRAAICFCKSEDEKLLDRATMPVILRPRLMKSVLKKYCQELLNAKTVVKIAPTASRWLE